MGRTAKFSDNRLLDAVVQYAEAFPHEIKPAALARWARENIEGLEDVRDYHFTRPIKNPRTGKLEQRECTKRLEEYNATRSLRNCEKVNAILSNVSIDVFLGLSERDQRKQIQDARDIVSKYKREVALLQYQNASNQALLSEISVKLDEQAEVVQKYESAKKIADSRIAILKRFMEDKQLEKSAYEMGISDGDFNLQRYIDSLTLDDSEIINIDAEIRRFQAMLGDSTASPAPEKLPDDWKKNLADELTNFSE